MKIIPYARQEIQQDDIDAVVATLKSDYLTQGPQVEGFEKEFAKYVGSKHSIAVNNGTTGLHLAAVALGVTVGDRVLCVSNTFVASANCILYCGADIDFVDINPQTYCLDIEKLRNILESSPKGKYKGLVAVDFAGYGLPFDQIYSLAKKHGLFVIEDACHAPGAEFTDASGRKVKSGSGEYSDITAFSFHPVKHIAVGEGGMLTTNNDELAKRMRLYRTHGITRDPQAFVNNAHGGWYYEMQELGFNYRISDILCALGRSQLAKLPESIKRRNVIADRYDNGLKGLPVGLPMRERGMTHAFHLYVVQAENRLSLYDFLKERGVYTQVHYIPVHQQPYYTQRYGKTSLPITESYYEKALSLPMYPGLTDEEQDYVIAAIRDFYGKH